MVSPAKESTFGAPVVVSKTGGRRRKRKSRKTHRRKCCKCKRKCGKTCSCKKNGKCLKRCIPCHKRRTKKRSKRRRTRRRRTKRRRTRRRRMRGGAWIQKPEKFKNPMELNKKVMDPPIPSKNIRLSDVKVPGVQLGGRVQRGGGVMDIVPGWNDLVDIGRTTLVGGKNFYNQLRGDKRILSPLASKDQYKPRRKLDVEFPDIGNIHEGAEKQAAEYKLNN